VSTITTEQREKLTKLVRLANFLDDLPHDKFHMAAWASCDYSENSCGTAGCACGWAATVYSNEGWSFFSGAPRRKGRYADVAFAEFFGISPKESVWITLMLGDNEDNGHDRGSPWWPTYTTEYGLDDVDDITPRHAADRIRKVVARYDPSLLEDRAKPELCLTAAHDGAAPHTPRPRTDAPARGEG